MNKTIYYSNGLKQKTPLKIEYEELEKKLRSKYNKSRKRGLSLYEYFDLTKTDFKLFFDIDYKLDLDDDVFDDVRYINMIELVLKEFFYLEDNEIFISSDNREMNDYYKISYHIIINKKTNIDQMLDISKKLKIIFDKMEMVIEDKIYYFKIDNSVYSKGLQKFRTLYSKKDNDKNSLLIPSNENDKLYQHLIQVIEKDILDVDMDLFNEKIKEKMGKIDDKNNTNDLNMEEIINLYDIHSTKEGINCKLHIIKKGFECPFCNRVHSNNHCYLVEFKDTLYLKCFSEECNKKMKVLYNNIDTNTLEFDIDVFNSFKLKNGSNYEQKREYFERYYKYFVDSDTFNRVKIKKNKKYDYYDTNLVEVKKSGLNHLNFLKIQEGDNEPKKQSFIKEYSFDNKRTNLFDMIFDPDNTDKNYYNLFDGFNYQNVLDKNDEITEEDEENLQFLLKFLKENVCENNDEFLDYFLSHLSLIIQQPSFLNHIIFLLYSSKQGTGKSAFLKFFSKVLGQKYSYVGSYSQILEKHSTSALGKFINIIEEVDIAKSKKVSEDMKNLSQREEFVYNGKNQLEKTLSCFVRYFLTSNNSNCISIPKNDRRYVIYEFLKISDEDVINKMDRIYENKKLIYLFGDYLNNYNIKFKTRNDWIKNKPITTCYKLFIYNDSVSSFLKDLYNKNDYFDEYDIVQIIQNKLEGDIFKMKTKHFYQYYKNYCMECNLKPFQKGNFYKNIRTNYNFIIKVKNKGNDTFKIDMKKINKHFDIDIEYKNKYV